MVLMTESVAIVKPPVAGKNVAGAIKAKHKMPKLDLSRKVKDDER